MTEENNTTNNLPAIDKYSYAKGLEIGKLTRMRKCIQCNDVESIPNDHLCYSCKYHSGMVSFKVLLVVIVGMLFISYLLVSNAYKEIDSHCQILNDANK